MFKNKPNSLQVKSKINKAELKKRMHYWSLALSSKALKTVHAWQVFWLAPVIERLPVINWQLTIDSWQWIIQLSVVGCPLSENSGKSVVQYIFFNCQLFIINFQLKNELTAAGLFRIYTWFPFNHFSQEYESEPLQVQR